MDKSVDDLQLEILRLENLYPDTSDDIINYVTTIHEFILVLKKLIELELEAHKELVNRKLIDLELEIQNNLKLLNYVDYHNRAVDILHQYKNICLKLTSEYYYGYGNTQKISPIKEEFTETMECPICYDNIIVPIDELKIGGWGEIHRLKTCLHVYCQDCIFTHTKTLILDGKVQSISCPDCQCELPDDEIKCIVGEPLFEKYKKFQILQELRSNPDTKWCPNPECDYGKTGNLEDSKIICDYCSTIYCRDCSLFWHEGETCQDTLRRFQKKNRKEKKSDKWIKKNSKKCPKCHISIIKQSGCNHMTCDNCNYSFCWVCMEEFIGYEHYSKGKCKGKMYFQNPLKKAAFYFGLGTTIVLIGCIAVPIVILCLPFYGLYRLTNASINPDI